MFQTRRLASRRHLAAPAVVVTAVAGTFPEPPAYFPPRAFRSRFTPKLKTPPEHNQYPQTPATPVPTLALGADFVTRKFASRKKQSLDWINLDPQPPFIPYAAYLPPRSFWARFKTTLLRLPEHNEFPSSPPAATEPGAILVSRGVRRRSRTGLFLTAADYIEAEVVQPPPAVHFISPFPPVSRRRRTTFRLERIRPIDFVEKAPPAGEEFESAWRAATSLFRRDTRRRLRPLPTPVIPRIEFPGHELIRALYRRATGFRLTKLPLLSFFEPPQTLLPSYRQWPTLRRRGLTRRALKTQVPEHITLRTPPDEQGYPAFRWPERAFRIVRRYVFVTAPAFIVSSAVGILGLQPPQYVVGRMSTHGKTLRAPLSLHGISVDGSMAATHAVDGTMDPSEGHEGSVL